MHIDRIEFSNYGVFTSKNSADFVTVDGRRINLIVAEENGFGKTTLLEAFQLALFGLRVPVSKMVGIRLGAKRAIDDNGSCVGLVLSEENEAANSSAVSKFIIKREFSYNNGDIEENFSASRHLVSPCDGECISYEVIENLLPGEIAGMVLWQGAEFDRISDDAKIAEYLGRVRLYPTRGRKNIELAPAEITKDPSAEFEELLKAIELSISREIRRLIWWIDSEIYATICRESFSIALLIPSGGDVRDFCGHGDSMLVRYAVRGVLAEAFFPSYPVILESPFLTMDEESAHQMLESAFFSSRQVILICSRLEVSMLSKRLRELVSSVHLIKGDGSSQRSWLVPAMWPDLRI